MFLAHAINVGEDSVICDMAETYGLYDYRSIPCKTAACLAFGLRDDSRIKLQMTGSNVSFDRILMAGMLDQLSYLSWTKTKAAEKGKNRPKSILEQITKERSVHDDDVVVFDSPEAFEEAYRKIIEG